MADLNDLQRIACSLPGVVQEERRPAFAVLNKGKRKGFAWVWMERIDPKRARVPNLEVIAIRVRNELEKEALIASEPTKFFTEAHYNGFPAILVRLAAVEVDELEALLVNGWRCQAPPALVRGFERGNDDRM